MTFGEEFKAEREKRKLPQQEAADALGINRRMITPVGSLCKRHAVTH